MKLKALTQVIGATTLALGYASTALAGNGLYIGGSIGEMDADVCGGLAVVSCDDSDTSWKIYGGYEVSPNLALEGGWIDLGEYSASGFGGTISTDSDGFFVNGKGILPLNEAFSVFGKVGFLFWDTDVSGTINTSDDGTDLIFGFGAQYMLNEQFSIVGEWERYDNDNDVDFLSIGAIYKF